MGGRSGTLGEFAIAYEEGTFIGVLTGTGGITNALRDVAANLHEATGAEVTYDAPPAQLVGRLRDRYKSQDYVCPCRPAGRQGEGTRGRRLQNGEATLRIFGEDIPVRARVETIHGLSAHADADGLLRWLRTAARIRKDLGSQAHVPEYRDQVTLDGAGRA